MIFITVDNGDRHFSPITFQYKGDIELYTDGPFVVVNAISHDDDTNNLYTWDRKVFDMLWLDTIVNIEGRDD